MMHRYTNRQNPHTDVDDHPFPEQSSEADHLHISVSPTVGSISQTNLTTAIEEVENDIHSKTDEVMELMATRIMAKVDEIRDPSNGARDILKAKELELLERQVVAQEAMLTLNNNQILREAAAKKHDALVEAKAKANSVLFYVKELDKVVNETRDWKNASNYKVKRAMRNVVEWKEEMYKIIETKRELKTLVEKNGFTDEDDVKQDRVEREVDGLKGELDAVILSIEKEDDFRALCTLDTTPVLDPVKLPEFSGKDGEDFHLFKPGSMLLEKVAAKMDQNS